MICGDLNARTGRENDFISTAGDKHIFEGNLINTETLKKEKVLI